MQDGSPEALDERGGQDRSGDGRDRHRRGGDPGVQGRAPESGLEEDVEHKDHPAHGADEADDKAEAGDVEAAAEDRRLDERRAAGPHAAYLPQPEEPEHGDAEGGEGEAPRRPAELAAFHERVDERRATRDGQGDARTNTTFFSPSRQRAGAGAARTS